MRVLVVEDNTNTRSLLRRSLRQEGHEVETAGTVASGLDLALDKSFDVLVLDISLPDGSGLDLCKQLRSQNVATPILMLTALGSVQDRIAGLDAGADDYLRKPFSLGELQARVRALGRRRGAPVDAQIRAGTLCLDLVGRRLERDGATVPLTGREWSVLEFLAATPNQAVSRTELLRRIWSGDDPASAQSLEVIVSRLRRKLGSAEDGIHIITERGFGYRLVTPGDGAES